MWGGSRSWRLFGRHWSGLGRVTARWWPWSARPGGGKSRLVYEFVHWRDCVGAGRSPFPATASAEGAQFNVPPSHHTPGWLVLESASVSYGKATPYFPVIDLLKRYAHVEEHDDLRTIRAKVTGQVVTLDAAL